MTENEDITNYAEEPDERYKLTVYINKSTKQRIDSTYKEANCKSRSEFVNDAIIFYADYVVAEECSDYFPKVLVSTVKSSFDSFENRIANLIFKLAVELSMLMHITAANYKINEDVLASLRGMCVQEVSKLHGKISFENAFHIQRGDE